MSIQPTADLPIEEQAERVRMCLAEAGYPDPGHVTIVNNLRGGASTVGIWPSVPADVAWKALDLVAVNGPICFACFDAFRECRPDDHAEGCTGDGWFL
jgi:hypothetical protein